MDVGFVEQYDRIFVLVGNQPFDVFALGDRACRVVGIADVINTGIRVCRQHRLHVVRIGSLHQGHTRNLDANKLG